MPTSRPQKAAPDYTAAPPSGMWYEDRQPHDTPFLARWRDPEGKKRGKRFATEADRADFAEGWVEQRERFGKAAQHISPADVAIWTAFSEMTGGTHPLTVAREWLGYRRTESTLTTNAAWSAFNAVQEGRKLAPDSHRQRRLHGRRFCAFFDKRLIASLKTEEIDRWIASLKSVRNDNEPMEPKSKRNHLKTIRHLYAWLIKTGKLTYNPADAVLIPDATKIDDETGEAIHRDINILTVEQVRQLFRANVDAVCVGRLALEFFGGLRYTSAARLVADDIKWEEKGIVMPGPKHKSTNRKYVDGWPEVLFLWMNHAPKACWDLTQRQYSDEKREAFVRAGLKPPVDDEPATEAQREQFEKTKNVARHSFATYHAAAFRDSRETCRLMTKTSIQSFNDDYRGRATNADGLAYFGITPAACLPPAG